MSNPKAYNFMPSRLNLSMESVNLKVEKPQSFPAGSAAEMVTSSDVNMNVIITNVDDDMR